jgi:hypothetical protein
MTTIIQPIVIPVERNCIIEQGTRYCESKAVTKEQLGIIIIGTIIFFAWIFSIMYFLSDDNKGIAMLILFVPIIILLIYLFS